MKKTFTLGQETVSITLASQDGSLGLGAILWDSTFLLGAYLLKRYVSLRGKRVIELGCGLGLASVCALRLGAAVTATDSDKELLVVTEKNLQGVKPIVSDEKNEECHNGPVCASYCWGDDLAKSGLKAPYDIVMGSDVVYSEDAMPSLTTSLLDLTGPDSLGLLVVKLRDDWQTDFIQSLDKHFEVQQVEESDIRVLLGSVNVGGESPTITALSGDEDDTWTSPNNVVSSVKDFRIVVLSRRKKVS